jgi:hypothetical protein
VPNIKAPMLAVVIPKTAATVAEIVILLIMLGLAS